MTNEECLSLLNMSTRYLSIVKVDVDNGALGDHPVVQRAGFESDVTRVPRESLSLTRVSAKQSQYNRSFREVVHRDRDSELLGSNLRGFVTAEGGCTAISSL